MLAISNRKRCDVLVCGGGAAGVVDAALTAGGASGDLASGVTLVDSSFFNILASSFAPGSLLSFAFGFTTNVDAGGTPDQFSLALLHADGAVVATQELSRSAKQITIGN